jgi:hypothetical protein
MEAERRRRSEAREDPARAIVFFACLVLVVVIAGAR